MSAMTEEEARKKWCPATRDRLRFADAASALPAPEDYCGDMAAAQPCLGSRCMAWRWDSNSPEFEFSIGLASDLEHLGGGWFVSVNQKDVPPGDLRFARDNPKRTGFCGLAGAPTP